MLPPSPAHILRGHRAQLNALSFSLDNERLYSGDASGQIIVTSTRSLRTLVSWRAHTGGILGVEEWNEDFIITHGRDNKLHVWTRVHKPTSLAETAATPALPLPTLKFSINVNALNYCRFSLLPASKGSTQDADDLLALPNLIESSFADIWIIPSPARLHAAIGQAMYAAGPGDGRGENKTGIIMSLHLFRASHNSASSRTQLRLLMAYEDGSVSLLVRSSGTIKTSAEGKGWNRLWRVKSHGESIMAMTVKRDNTAAFSVSADHLLCRYNLEDGEANVTRSVTHRTKHPGNGSIAIQDDGRVLGVGGWDGKIRLYSTRTFKALGTLSYHREGCYTLAFAFRGNNGAMEHDGEGFDRDEIEARAQWFAAGGKDHRISIWQLMDFNNTK